MIFYIAGDKTRVFGTKTCFSGCKELEAINGRRERNEIRNLPASLSEGNRFTWEERRSGTIAIHNRLWNHSRIDQIERPLCREDKEEVGSRTSYCNWLVSYMCIYLKKDIKYCLLQTLEYTYNVCIKHISHIYIHINAYSMEWGVDFLFFFWRGYCIISGWDWVKICIPTCHHLAV